MASKVLNGYTISCASFTAANGFYKSNGTATYKHSSDSSLTFSKNSSTGLWEVKNGEKRICYSEETGKYDPTSIRTWQYAKKTFFSEKFKECSDMSVTASWTEKPVPAPAPAVRAATAPSSGAATTSYGATNTVTEFVVSMSESSLVFTNGSTTARRPGSVSCYPAAFATLPANRCTFNIRLDALPSNGNTTTFGLCKKGMKTSYGDGFGKNADSWGIGQDSSATMPHVASCKTTVTSMSRKLVAGDVVSGEVDVVGGWFEVRVNQREFTHRFTIPAGKREDYLFGMTLATDHQVSIHKGAIPSAAPKAAPAAAGALQMSTAWALDISNSELTYTNASTTAKRVGNISCYPACFAKLNSEYSKFVIRLDAAPRSSNWVSFGLAKRGMEKINSDGMGRTADTWGIADDRSAASSNALSAANKVTVNTLPRKLKDGDILIGEVNTRAGWFDVRLNAEYSHRFTIPAGSKEDYWFGMTFANDHQATILTAVPSSFPSATVPAPAATTTAAAGSYPTAWSPDISNTNLVFSNGNKTAMRPGNISAYPAAFARLTAEKCTFEVVIDAASEVNNWLTFGIAKKGFAISGSNGFGEAKDTWGFVDDRNGTRPTTYVYVGADTTKKDTLKRKFRTGDRLTAEVDTRAGWCEVRLNQTEYKYRFTIPAGSKEDYWFGLTFANDHQASVIVPGSYIPTPVPKAAPVPVVAATGASPLAWSTDISNTNLVFTNGNKTAKRPGSASSYPAAFARLSGDRCTFEVVIDAASEVNNWLTFGIAKKGFAISGSDGFGEAANTWGFVDDRNGTRPNNFVYVGADKVKKDTLKRKFRTGDRLTAEVDTRAGWCEVRLNQTEYKYRFTIPAGSKEDYWFGMTFANDHQASVIVPGSYLPPQKPLPAPAPAVPVVPGPSPLVWSADISNTNLVFSNGNKTAMRPGKISSYPAAFARLTAERCTFEVVIDAASDVNNWLTFGLAKKDFPVTGTDGFGEAANTWGFVDNRNPTKPSEFIYVGADKVKKDTLKRKFRTGDRLTAEVDTRAGWCEVRLNQTEYKYRFTIPAGSKEDYWFGMTFANDHQASVIVPGSYLPPPKPVPAPAPAPAVVLGPAPLTWSPDISNTNLIFSNSNKTAMRPGKVSAYPAAFARLSGERCTFEVVIDAASDVNNWLTFGIAKKGFAVSGSNGFGEAKDTWGFVDNRNPTKPSEFVYVGADTTKKDTLKRKFRTGDRLTAEVDTRAGWCEVRLNQTEYKYRFTIPAGSKEDYWFGMTFANDHQATVIVPGSALPAARPASTPAPTPAPAPTAGASGGPQVWNAEISNTNLVFSNGNKTAMRPGNISAYPAAFARLTAEKCTFEVVIDAASDVNNWLTFGIAKKDFPVSGSDGFGEAANTWGFVDNRNPTKPTDYVYVGADKVKKDTLKRKFRTGDRLTAEVDTRAGWCEVRLNQTEYKYRFTIPAGSKEDYWFGMTFANDHKATVVSAPAAAAPAPASLPSPPRKISSGALTIVNDWTPSISDGDLTFSNGNTVVMRKGNISCYPASFAKLTSDHCKCTIRLDEAPTKGNWVSFGLAKRGMATKNSDGMGRTADTWGIADERSSGASSTMPVVAGCKITATSLVRKLQAGDVLTAEVDTRSGWVEICHPKLGFSHVFAIPTGSREDYWFGMTFANDHQATIVGSGTPSPSPSPTPTKTTASAMVVCRAWSTDISNGNLTFSNLGITAKRPGSISSYPAAFAKLGSEHAKFAVRLDAAPRNGNWLTFGLTKQGMAMSGSDGMGRTANTWGIADSSSVTVMPIACAANTTVGTLKRKLTEGDVLSCEVNTVAGWFEVRLNQTEFTHRFTIPAGSKEDYWFGMTFANDHQATVVNPDTLPTKLPPAPTPVPAVPKPTVTPAPGPKVAGPLTFCTAWATERSDTLLTYTANKTTVHRMGGVSCLPAAFARLPSEHAMLRVVLDSVPATQNWLSFGLAPKDMATSYTDGMGGSANSFGVGQDNSSSDLPMVQASGKTVATLTRKLQTGDVLSAEVDLVAGWCELRLNKTEFTHRFTVPTGSKEDYLLGVTLASDHQVSILSSLEVVPDTVVHNDPVAVADDEQDDSMYDPVYVPPTDESDNDPVYVDPATAQANNPWANPAPPAPPAPYVAAFREQQFLITQQSLHAPMRRDWMRRRDELNEQYRVAKEAKPKDYNLVATLGLAVTELEKESSSLMLSEADCASLPKRHATLMHEMEQKCEELEGAGDFLALKALAAELATLSAVKP